MANKKIKFELTAVNKTKAQFDKVTRQLNTLKNAGAGVAKAMIGVTVAIAATAVAFGAVVKKSFEFIDAIGKTATRTGLATSTIQAFSLAALESGTTIEGGNKALEKFARSVGDAQRGLKTTKDIFKALNVELVDQNGNYKTTDQLLEETAKGISGLNSQTEKATALANLFGRQGILLTGALEDLGEKGLKGFTDRAEELGLVLSDKSIRAVEVFNDKVSVIGLQLQTIKAQIMIGFLPVFEELRQTIANKISAIKNDFGGFDKLAVDVVNNVIEAIASTIETFGNFQNIINKVFKGVEISTRLLVSGFLSIKIAVLSVMNIFGDYEQQLHDAKNALIGNTKEIQEAFNRQTDFRDITKQVASNVREFKISMTDLTDTTKIFNEEQEKLVDKSFDGMNALTAFKNKLTGEDSLSNALDQVAVSSMKKFEDSIIDGLKNGKLAFKDFADYVVEQLLRVAIQQMVVAQIVDPFRKFLGGFDLFSGSSSSGAGTSTTSGGIGFDGGGYTGMGVRAGGIDGKGGFPAILHPNETVIDHTKGQGMGATVNFNISTVDAAGFDQLLASRKGLITSIINNAMNNQGKMGVV
tara:strand:- start:2052 stop:3803 length:1752 start_codon:yes stop_codon:yes gene_type:complete